MTAEIFVGYRRQDAAAEAWNICSAIRGALGDDFVFMDVSTIRPGEKWPEQIEAALEAARTVVVVIGPGWLGAERQEGGRRIDDKDDWVRQEVERAIRGRKRIIPVVVRGGTMPRPEALPDGIKVLADWRHLEIRHEFWGSDIQLLLEQLRASSPQPSRLRTIAVAAAVLAFLGLTILVATVGMGRRTPTNACSGVRVTISEPTEGDRVSSSVDVFGAATIHETCRTVVLLGRERSASEWKVVAIGHVDTDGRWNARARLDGISGPVGELEMAAAVIHEPGAYQPGQSLPSSAIRGAVSKSTHVRRIE